MKTIPTTSEVAAYLERSARNIAPTIALLIALAITTYNAGYQLGRIIHQVNDWLAANWPTRPTTTTTEPTPLAEIIAETGATVAIDDVITLRAQGLSQRAIAAQLGISRATVRRRLATI